MKKKQKNSKADFLRGWHLPSPPFQWSQLRYKNPPEKGVYWYYFSLYIRERDVNKYGTCISCGRPITVSTSQAGHFMPAATCGRDLIFDVLNVNAECSRCNAWDETHLLSYADNLDKRYGEGTASRLRERRRAYLEGPPLKDFKGEYYAELIKKLPNFPSE